MQKEIAQILEIDFSDDSDYDLLGYMAMKDVDPSAARAAWEEFYTRHIRYILGILKRAYGEHLDTERLNYFAADTLIRVYERADKFKENPEIGSREDQSHHVRGWMATIAENIYTDQLRAQGGFTTVLPEDEEEWEKISFEVFTNKQTQNRNSTNELKKLKLRWIREAFESLNEKEKYVIRVTAEYDRPNRKNQRLPNKISKDLAQALNTTPDNVRQIRKRAKAAIQRYVNEKEAKRSGHERNR